MDLREYLQLCQKSKTELFPLNVPSVMFNRLPNMPLRAYVCTKNRINCRTLHQPHLLHSFFGTTFLLGEYSKFRDFIVLQSVVISPSKYHKKMFPEVHPNTNGINY